MQSIGGSTTTSEVERILASFNVPSRGASTSAAPDMIMLRLEVTQLKKTTNTTLYSRSNVYSCGVCTSAALSPAHAPAHASDVCGTCDINSVVMVSVGCHPAKEARVGGGGLA